MIIVAALVALPAIATGKPHAKETPKGNGKPEATASYRVASGMCGAERTLRGKRAFRRKYGFEHPMRACVKVTRQLINAAGRLADRDCRAELTDLGAPDFLDEYGEDAGSTVAEAISVCIAETIDAILYPDGVTDDERL